MVPPGPQLELTDLAGNPIPGGGVNLGTVNYQRVSMGGGSVGSVASVERAFVLKNLGGAVLNVATSSSNAVRLVPSVCSTIGFQADCEGTRSVDPLRIGALVLKVTLPLGSSTLPGSTPDSATVTLTTNDPTKPSIPILVAWTWQEGSATVYDASTAMFMDFGDLPQNQSRERTFAFQTGRATGQVTSVTPTGAGFSLVTPNPNPFVAEAFPVSQPNVEVPLTFTVRGMSSATSGHFLGTVMFGHNANEPNVDALVVGHSVATPSLAIPADLASTTIRAEDSSTLRTMAGSERTLVSIPSGEDGIEYNAGNTPPGTSVVYLHSNTAATADPGAPADSGDGYLFKRAGTAKPMLITKNFSDDAVGLAVNFGSNLSYVIDLSGTADDILRITDAGTTTILAAGAGLSSWLGVDSAGNVYGSRVQVGTLLALRKYSPAGVEDTTFASSTVTSNLRKFEIASDVIYAIEGFGTGATGRKLTTAGADAGGFTIPFLTSAGFQWFSVDAAGNLVFGDNPAGSLLPQDLKLVTPGGTVQDIGTLPREAFQGDF